MSCVKLLADQIHF